MKPMALMLGMVLAVGTVTAGDYRGGGGASVRGFVARDFDAAKGMGMPLLIYVYDEGPRLNGPAKSMEGSDLLGSIDVMQRTKSFGLVKIKDNGTDSRGWPAHILARGKNGAALLVATPDFKQTVWFDRTTPKAQMTKEYLLTVMDNVQSATRKKVEEQSKAVAKTDAKAATKDEAKSAANQIKIPALNPPPEEEQAKPAAPPPPVPGLDIADLLGPVKEPEAADKAPENPKGNSKKNAEPADE